MQIKGFQIQKFYLFLCHNKPFTVKYLIATSFLLLFSVLALAQQHPNSGLIIGANLGLSKVNTELTPGFKTIPNEFTHKMAPAFSIELSKLIGDHLEIGTDVHLTFLKGDTDDPQFSAEGIHPEMRDPITEPVEYRNQLFGQKFFLGFYFRRFEYFNHAWRLEPFLRVGGGYNTYTSKFRYIDAPDDELIFGKNAGRFNYWNLLTGVYFASAGIRTYKTRHLIINTTFTINYSNYDFLDVVHNYNDDVGSSEYTRRTDYDIRGIYTELKIGIFYHSNELGKHKSRKGKYKQPVMPFSGR